MAENLLWWLAGPLAERKVVVWAHNYHVMNDLYLGQETRAAAPAGEKPAFGPMGRFLKAELGSDLYTIGFASHSGEFLDMDAEKGQPVVPGDLEALLHSAGRPWLFLDVSRLPADHWLRTPWTASFYFHQPVRSTWTRVYDGVFFVDVQKPSTTPAAR